MLKRLADAVDVRLALARPLLVIGTWFALAHCAAGCRPEPHAQRCSPRRRQAGVPGRQLAPLGAAVPAAGLLGPHAPGAGIFDQPIWST